MISIIVPAYHEETEIYGLLDHLRSLTQPGPVEIIVVDGAGGSTLAAAEASGERFSPSQGLLGVVSPPGRAHQMNVGARLATGETLLFLHVDTRLPRSGLSYLATALEAANVGAFDLRFETAHPGIRMVGVFGRLRSRVTRIPFGDQAHFFRREFFEEIGGYPELPIMEDVALMRRVKNAGFPLTLISSPARTSDRRYRRRGVLINTVANWWRQMRFRAGTPAERLAPGYRAHGQPGGGRQGGHTHPGAPGPTGGGRGGGTGSGRSKKTAYALFFRLPEEGRVKTRLASNIGQESALACYIALLEDLCANLAPLGNELVPFVDRKGPLPPSLSPLARTILGEARIQQGENLGTRMERAFSELFEEGYERVVLTGTDIPGLTPELYRAAGDSLENGDVILGPTGDGGYYLVGFRRDRFLPGLFQQKPWGQESVWDATIGQIERVKATLRLAPLLEDIDTLVDLKRWYKTQEIAEGGRRNRNLWNFCRQTVTVSSED